jgi:hypothetical protein
MHAFHFHVAIPFLEENIIVAMEEAVANMR